MNDSCMCLLLLYRNKVDLVKINKLQLCSGINQISHLAAYFILENNLPLRSALETKKTVHTEIRTITNENFGTNYLQLTPVCVCVC